jgi:tetrahydromethanopterin S-methyltransferase subunit A
MKNSRVLKSWYKMTEKVKVEKWPVLPGRYTVGNKESCVAVCTLKDIDIELPKEKVAIYGPCNTENIGIERVVKNIISNPNIRFLILCCEEPKGHFVGQALKALKENGIDENCRIIGAIGALPFLKNVSKEEIEVFRKQVEIVDLIGCTDLEKIEKAIDECLAKDPGAFRGEEVREEVEVIKAWHDCEKEFVPDPKGFFLINIDKDSQRIIVEHYSGYGANAKLNCKIIGKNAEEICATIVRLKLVSRLEHAAYLGRELQKAELALKHGKEYEQEKDIEF